MKRLGQGLRRAADRLLAGPARRALVRVHADQEGAIIDYALVLVVVVLPLVALLAKVLQMIGAYFRMIAFYATWPFL